MKTALKKYSKKRVKAIVAILQKPDTKHTVVTFHELRVEIKKLSALFELANNCSKICKLGWVKTPAEQFTPQPPLYHQYQTDSVFFVEWVY